MRIGPGPTAVLLPATGAAVCLLAVAGARQASRLTGLGPADRMPLLFAAMIGAAAAFLIAGFLAARVARREGEPGPLIPATAAGAILITALLGFLLPALAARGERVWSALSSRGRTGFAAFFVDALPGAFAAVPPIALAAFLIGLMSRRASGRSAGLLLLGGSGALVLVASNAFPSSWLAAAAPLTLLALSPAIWLLMRAEGAGPGERSAAVRRDAGGLRLRLAAVLLAVAGASGFVLLVGLHRIGTLIAGETLRSGSTFGIVALTAAGFGALMAPRALRRAPGPWRLLGGCLALVGVMGLFASISTDLLPHAYLGVLSRAGATESGELGALFTVGAILLLGPSLFAGAALGTAGTIIGAAFPAGAAALGAAAGTTLPGTLIPALGLQGTLALSGTCLAVAGALLVFLEEGAEWGRAVRGLALLSLCGFLLWTMEPWDRRILTAGVAGNPALYLEGGEPRLVERVAHDRIVSYLDGAFHTAAVKIVEGRLAVLFLDGSVTPLEGLEVLRAQRMSGHLPALIGPERGRALVLGAGPPGTVSALRLHAAFEIDVAAGAAGVGRLGLESDRMPGDLATPPPTRPIEPAASPETPAAPPVRLLDEDGIRALVSDREGYDLITAPPLVSGSALRDLLDQHAIAMMRDHLRPGGIVCLPLTLRGLSLSGIEAAIQLFRRAFPGGSAWSVGSDLFLIGGAGAPVVDVGRVVLRVRRPGVSEDLASIGLGDPLKILSLRVFPLALESGETAPAWSQGLAETPELFDAAAAEGRLRPQIPENLRWIASRISPGALSVQFPDAWSVEARQAATRRLEILREVRMRVILAHAALSAGDPAEALRRSRSALELDPGDFAARSFGARALAAIAEAALARGQRGVAAGEYEQALEIDPASIEALTALSWIRHEQGSPESAEALVRSAIVQAPRTALLRYRLGILRLEAGDLREAEESLLLSHDLDPRQPEPLLGLGDIERRRGHATQATELYHRALTLGGREAETRTALASLHLDSGGLEDAAREIETALRAKPGDPEALFTRAILRARRGERDGARRDLLAAVTTGGATYRARAMAKPDLRALLEGKSGGGWAE